MQACWRCRIPNVLARGFWHWTCALGNIWSSPEGECFVRIHNLFLSACSPEPLDWGHCWHVQRLKLQWGYSIFFTWFCRLFDDYVHVCPMTPNKSKGIAEKGSRLRGCHIPVPFRHVSEARVSAHSTILAFSSYCSSSTARQVSLGNLT